MILEVVQSFGIVEQVDGYRENRRRFGVAPGGAFDRESLALANALVGHSPDARAWELGMANVRFRVIANGMVAVVGASAALSVDGRGVTGQAVFPVHAGAELHVGPPDRAARVYVVGRPGGFERPRRLAGPPLTILRSRIRVVAGPQSNHFDLETFTNSGYVVAPTSNRVGLRLEGPVLSHGLELPSEPACVGAIQVTGSGEPVILGPDGPTIGGYPKIAVVIDADLDRIGQLRPGDTVQFQLVSQEEARAARRERIDRIAKSTAILRLA